MPAAETVIAPALADAVLFDVDGTLCDVRSIRHFVQPGPPGTRAKRDFDRFHRSSAECPPYPEVRDLAIAARAAGLAIVVVTGRAAKWRLLTAAWLTRQEIHSDALFTRGANDFRPDHVVKTEILASIRQRFRPVLAVDDREDIIDLWQAARIPTVRVDDDGRLGHLETPIGAPADPRVIRLLRPPADS